MINSKIFIVEFDGPNCAGKSTLIKEVANRYNKLTQFFPLPHAVIVEEPAKTGPGVFIREGLFKDEAREIDDFSRLLLYGAAKNISQQQLLRHIRKTTVEQNLQHQPMWLVLKDRGVASSFVYQSDAYMGDTPHKYVKKFMRRLHKMEMTENVEYHKTFEHNMIRFYKSSWYPDMMVGVLADTETLIKRHNERSEGSHGGYVVDENSIYNIGDAYKEIYTRSNIKDLVKFLYLANPTMTVMQNHDADVYNMATTTNHKLRWNYQKSEKDKLKKHQESLENRLQDNILVVRNDKDTCIANIADRIIMKFLTMCATQYTNIGPFASATLIPKYSSHIMNKEIQE